MKVKNAFIVVLLSVFCMTSCNDEKFEITPFHIKYLQPIITQYFIDNKSEIWLLFLIAHSKR